MNVRSYIDARLDDGWHVMETRQRPGENARRKSVCGPFETRELALAAMWGIDAVLTPDPVRVVK
jgi:hypothetical protein